MKRQGGKTAKSATGRRAKQAQRSRSASAARGAQNAIALLKADHREVDALLKQYEKARDGSKERIARSICLALTVHATIEEELLYPAAREVLDSDDTDLVDEADVEHASIKQLVRDVENSSREDSHYDAKVKVIGEYVKHHVKEEEKELFPRLRDSDVDLKELGAQLAQRKAALMRELKASR